jgi:hypothetical protein
VARADQLAAERARQRRRRAGVERHLEQLALLRVELRVAPAEQPRHEREVARARHGQELGGSLKSVERERRGEREPRSAQACSGFGAAGEPGGAGAERGGSAARRRRRRTRSQATVATIAASTA